MFGIRFAPTFKNPASSPRLVFGYSELAQEIANRGPRFEVEPMTRHELYERELNRDEMYGDFDLDRDGQSGYGYGD